jgi:hypothetical protein
LAQTKTFGTGAGDSILIFFGQAFFPGFALSKKAGLSVAIPHPGLAAGIPGFPL